MTMWSLPEAILRAGELEGEKREGYIFLGEGEGVPDWIRPKGPLESCIGGGMGRQRGETCNFN